MPVLSQQNNSNTPQEKHGSMNFFMWFMGIIISILVAILSFYRNAIKSIDDKYQVDHDKLIKLEDLKVMLPKDHDTLLKLEERVNNLKK